MRYHGTLAQVHSSRVLGLSLSSVYSLQSRRISVLLMNVPDVGFFWVFWFLPTFQKHTSLHARIGEDV